MVCGKPSAENGAACGTLKKVFWCFSVLISYIYAIYTYVCWELSSVCPTGATSGVWAYSGGPFDICVTYGPNPQRFQGFETLIVPFPGSFWAVEVEGRVYERPHGIGTSADRGASSESKILRARARRQRDAQTALFSD